VAKDDYSAGVAHICPTCNQKIPDSEKIKFNDEESSITRFGEMLFLFPTEYKILKVLNRAYPYAIDTDDALIAIYGYDTDRVLNNVSVIVSKLRRKIAHLALEIPDSRDSFGGYKLVKHPRGWDRKIIGSNKRRVHFGPIPAA
jgi:DNA-binding response OmpR family regulator